MMFRSKPSFPRVTAVACVIFHDMSVKSLIYRGGGGLQDTSSETVDLPAVKGFYASLN